MLHPRGGFQADLATLDCVTSSFPAEHRTSTHTQALILDQTTHRGTLNAQRPVQTEPDAHKRGARRLVANNMLIFETLFFWGQKAGCGLVASGAETGRHPVTSGWAPRRSRMHINASLVNIHQRYGPLAAGLRPHGSMGSLPRSFV